MHMSRTEPSLRTAIPGVAILATAVLGTLGMTGNPSDLLSIPPEVHAKHHTLSLTLHAAVASDGKNSLYFDGQPNAPTLRLSPGDQLKITYINEPPAKAKEACAVAPCMHMTNLHFHGLTVSPDAPQDDVLGMLAAPDKLSATQFRFQKIIRLACIGTIRTRMERATARCLTACPEFS
jgi:FtsP/CotA-like multicopper oxidase with cupredoxin domain